MSPGIITAAFDYAFGAGFELKTSVNESRCVIAVHVQVSVD